KGVSSFNNLNTSTIGKINSSRLAVDRGNIALRSVEIEIENRTRYTAGHQQSRTCTCQSNNSGVVDTSSLKSIDNLRNAKLDVRTIRNSSRSENYVGIAHKSNQFIAMKGCRSN